MSGRVIGTYCLGFFAAAITSILRLELTRTSRAAQAYRYAIDESVNILKVNRWKKNLMA